MYRTIECHTWDDEWFQELDPIGKLTFLYLLTNIRQTACGAFRITLRTISTDLGCDKGAITTALEALQIVRKVVWWPGEGVVWVKNFYKYQRANSSDKFRVSAVKALRDFPQVVRDTALIAYPELADTAPPSTNADTLSIPYRYPTDRGHAQNKDKDKDKTESESKTDEPPAPEPQPIAKSKSRSPTPGQTSIPDGFEPSPVMFEAARAKYPKLDIEAATDEWVSSMKSNTVKYRYTDWNQAWWTGMKRADTWQTERGGHSNGSTKQPDGNRAAQAALRNFEEIARRRSERLGGDADYGLQLGSGQDTP